MSFNLRRTGHSDTNLMNYVIINYHDSNEQLTPFLEF